MGGLLGNAGKGDDSKLDTVAEVGLQGSNTAMIVFVFHGGAVRAPSSGWDLGGCGVIDMFSNSDKAKRGREE